MCPPTKLRPALTEADLQYGETSMPPTLRCHLSRMGGPRCRELGVPPLKKDFELGELAGEESGVPESGEEGPLVGWLAEEPSVLAVLGWLASVPWL